MGWYANHRTRFHSLVFILFLPCPSLFPLFLSEQLYQDWTRGFARTRVAIDSMKLGMWLLDFFLSFFLSFFLLSLFSLFLFFRLLFLIFLSFSISFFFSYLFILCRFDAYASGIIYLKLCSHLVSKVLNMIPIPRSDSVYVGPLFFLSLSFFLFLCFFSFLFSISFFFLFLLFVILSYLSFSLTLDGQDGVPDRSRVFHVYGLPDFTRQIQEEKLIKYFSMYGSMYPSSEGREG